MGEIVARHPGGRPTILTPELQASIVSFIRAGNYIVDAAAIVGISRDTVFIWMRRGLDEGEGIYYDFAVAMQQARAEAVAMRVSRINQAGKDGVWQADAWWLERTDPENWGRRLIEVQGDAQAAVKVTLKLEAGKATGEGGDGA